MATTKTSVELSIPKARKVRGYLIQRLPIGRYLRAAQLIQDAPKDILQTLFPDAEPGELLKQLAALTKDGLQALFLRAIGTLPAYAVRVFAELSGIEEAKLLNDPGIGLDGLCEMLDAWIEVNGIENFIKAAGALADKVRKAAATAGSKG